MTFAPPAVAPPPARVAAVQRRTLSVLFVTQVIGGVGVAIGISVGALLGARLGGAGVSGLAFSAAVVGAALLAVPVTRLMRARGRRPGLAVAYGVGGAGALVVVAAAVTRSVPLLFAGMLLFGGGTAANLQARYTAVDLAEPGRRARQLSTVVWATTVGAVAGPNLTAPADAAVQRFGLPELAGPFVFSAVAFTLAATALLLLLRPDPLLLSRAVERAAGARARPVPAGSGAVPVRSGVVPAGSGAVPAPPAGMAAALRVVGQRPAARLGLAAVAVGHLVMVGVMSMTPVHIGQSHDSADVLRIVGVVISVHIAGMYALSPVVGWLTDRLGRRAVVLGGLGLLLAACAVAGTAGHDTVRLSTGLALLGLGWSGTMVAGSTLLTESVAGAVRPTVQGLSDLVMGLAGAAAGALSGVVVEWVGFPALTLLAALATGPLVVVALRWRVGGEAG
ncbi:MAG TPA: MFS transporter [Micromonosporaceae bacterium]|nr:MFS transporter [Micromonosporaceae bacterium]